MIECAVPQDILKYKTKFIGNFSARETICLGLGAMAGLGSYFGLFSGIEGKAKIYLSVIFIIPFFLFGFLQPFGQPLEKIMVQIIYDNLICPAIRKYEIRRPEYEKFLRSEEKEEPEILSQNGVEKGGKKKKKKNSVQKKNKEKKVTKSKEYKGIR